MQKNFAAHAYLELCTASRHHRPPFLIYSVRDNAPPRADGACNSIRGICRCLTRAAGLLIYISENVAIRALAHMRSSCSSLCFLCSAEHPARPAFYMLILRARIWGCAVPFGWHVMNIIVAAGRAHCGTTIPSVQLLSYAFLFGGCTPPCALRRGKVQCAQAFRAHTYPSP